MKYKKNCTNGKTQVMILMDKRIFILAVGTFIIGTDDFVIAGILPTLSENFNISDEKTGQLITAFSIAYAIGAPVLGTLFSNVNRKKLLIIAILLFSLFNLLAIFSPTYEFLLTIRVLTALAAALFTPVAMGTVSNIVPKSERGKALSYITAGLTVGIVLGVPLGTFIGNTLGWRFTFILIASIGFITSIGIVWTMPSIMKIHSEPLITRIKIMDKKITLAMLVTIISGTGSFMLYTYISPILLNITHLDKTFMSYFLFIIGVGSVLGNLIGGYLTDKIGDKKTIAISLTTLALTLLTFSALFYMEAGWITVTLATLAVFFWGLAGWAFNPSFNTLLISFNPKQASIIMSLSTSSMYIGITLAASIGGIVIHYLSINFIGFIGFLLVLLSLLLFYIINVNLRTTQKKSDHLNQ